MTYEEWLERLIDKLNALRLVGTKVDVVILFGRIDPDTHQPRVMITQRSFKHESI